MKKLSFNKKDACISKRDFSIFESKFCGMKKSLLTVLSFLFVISVFGQMRYFRTTVPSPDDQSVALYNKRYMEDKTFVGARFGIHIPIGDWSKNVNLGIGFSAQAKYFVTDKFAFGADFGYYRSSNKDVYLKYADTLFSVFDTNITTSSFTASLKYTAFTLNFEYYLSRENFKPYVGLGLGFHVANNSFKVATDSIKSKDFIALEGTYNPPIKANFGITPHVGIMASFNELWHFNADVRYNIIFAEPVAMGLSINVGILLNLSWKY